MVEPLINIVIHGDCIDVMKSMPDKCVDLVLTDPPYGIGKKISDGGGKRKNNRGKLSYISGNWKDEKPDQNYFNEIFRISKNQIIWGGNYFGLPPNRCFLIWNKVAHMPTLSDCEYAWTSFDKPSKMFSERPIDDEEKHRTHPTQKNLRLIKWCVANYSTPDSIIFDPFAGSGTTAIACLELGRNYILIEQEQEHVDATNNRINLWKEQLRLF